MVEIFLLSPYWVEFVLPFVLVFTLIFAILQKTELLGEGKKQIDAMVGLVVGLILIAFPGARGIVVLLMPFLAVSIVILLVFMLLYGFFMGKKSGEDFLHKGWKYAFGTILAVGLLSYLIFISGNWDFVLGFFTGGGSSQIWTNIILIVVIVGAIWVVVRDGGGISGGD